MNTILGAGGAIGDAIAQTCREQNLPVRLVSRTPHPEPGAETVAADLLDYAQTAAAVKGSDVVYLTAGLQYKTSVWQKSWPVIMENTIRACQEAHARLIFFDNIYCLGKVDGPMKEDTPFNPCSKKGEVRAKIATRLLDEIKKGGIKAMIARSADFYGPGCKTSGINLMVIDKLAKGKKAQCLGNSRMPHSFTYTPDCGNALITLSRDESAWGQIWHMPTAGPALTSRKLIQMAALEAGVEPGYSELGKGMCRMLGLFVPVLRELTEMFYQYDSPYIFDSSKIEARYGIEPTSYMQGIHNAVAAAQ